MSSQRITPERFRAEAARIRSTAAAGDEESQAHLLVTARLYEQMAASLPKGTRPARRRRRSPAAPIAAKP